jgi:hypothetical protein
MEFIMQKKILTLLLVAGATTAIADNSSSNNLYIGGGAGAGWNNNSAPAASFRLDGGYNFNEYWAVELGATGLTQSGGTSNQSVTYYDLSVKGTLPLSQAFALFAQVGGAYGSPGVLASDYTDRQANNAGYSQAGWDFLTSVGAQVNLTRQVSLNLTNYYYYGAPNPQGNANVLLAGIKYNF